MAFVPRNSISITYVRKLLAGAAREGISLEQLFAHCGLDAAQLAVPDARIDAASFIRLLQAVMKLTEDEFLGLGRGTKSKPGTFSMMAHAVINCRNLEKAIQRSAQFYELFDLPTRSTLTREGDKAIFEFGVTADAYREIILEGIVFLLVRFWSWLIGRNVTPDAIYFDFPAPTEAREFRHLFPCPVLFDQSCNRIVFNASFLNKPLVQNPLSLARFLKDSFAQLILGGSPEIGLPQQIRAIISKEYGNNFPDFSVICEKLNMTPQTLRRRLKDLNTSYQEIKDAIRQDASIYYLSKEELSIDEIALMMGFSEASSFHRAFKKWTGKTPASFRRELLGMDEEPEILPVDET